MKPVFVPKEARQTVMKEDEDPEEAEARRKQEAHLLLAEFVQLEGLTAAKRKEAELEATSGAFDPRNIDDTDGLDEEAELQAWRLRELLRMKMEKDEREARELEQIELERLRNLTEAEKQDLDRQKQAEWESKPKGEYKFLQKYYHKGAFFGDATDDKLLNRDYSAPTAADAGNKEMLPETMQVKDFGKRGRTKWTHLTAEDTTAFVDGWGDKKNPANYRSVGKMAGMKGDLSRPSKKHRPN
jgi:microfibrillar-associated protein 1